MPGQEGLFGLLLPLHRPRLAAPAIILSLDAFYLSVFGALNTRRLGHLLLALEAPRHLAAATWLSSTNQAPNLNWGLVPRYLWLNSSQLIHGYNPFGNETTWLSGPGCSSSVNLGLGEQRFMFLISCEGLLAGIDRDHFPRVLSWGGAPAHTARQHELAAGQAVATLDVQGPLCVGFWPQLLCGLHPSRTVLS